MHDLDRVLQEFESGIDALESGEYEYDEESAIEGDFEGDFESVFDEVEEMDLAAQLLEVRDDAQLDRFFGDLVRKVGGKLRQAVRSPVGRAIGGVLKNVARKALPAAGAALGNVLLPGVGGVAGGKLAAAAGRMFGLELEGMSPQDQEFEVARRVVRLGGEAVKQATQSPQVGSAVTIAKDAVARAAQQHAPGLVGGPAGVAPTSGNSGRSAGRTGRWFRRGHRIILLGA